MVLIIYSFCSFPVNKEEKCSKNHSYFHPYIKRKTAQRSKIFKFLLPDLKSKEVDHPRLQVLLHNGEGGVNKDWRGVSGGTGEPEGHGFNLSQASKNYLLQMFYLFIQSKT